MEQKDSPAIRDLVASASIFSNAMSEVMAAVLEQAAAGRISVAQSKVLTLIAHTEGIGVSDVALFLGVSTAAASKTVARLVDGGFVERTEAPDDRRVQRLSLTPEAWDILTAYEEQSAAVLAGLFGHLEPAQTKTMTASLDALSLAVARESGGGDEGCFRCGIYFRTTCLLRGAPGNRTCYQNLGLQRKAAVA